MEREYILPLGTVYLSGRLTAFNFEELCISSDYEKLYLYIYIYIYNVEKDIQLYIIYGIKGASWDIFSSESIMFTSLPPRSPPTVFQLLIQGMSLLVLPRILE